MGPLLWLRFKRWSVICIHQPSGFNTVAPAETGSTKLSPRALQTIADAILYLPIVTLNKEVT